MPKIIEPATFSAIVNRVSEGATVEAAAKAYGIHSSTIRARSSADATFREQLEAARIAGKAVAKVRRAELRASLAAPPVSPPAADHVLPQERRPSDVLRALVVETAPELIAVGEVRDGKLYMSPVGFDRLFGESMRLARQRQAPRA